MSTVLEVISKALLGGVLVVVFAMLSQTLSPKRFAGVFAAAPSIALPSLLITVAFDGPADAHHSCLGMTAGAAGFVVYGAIAPVLLRRFGTLRGAAFGLIGWLAVTAAVLPLSAGSSAVKAAGLLPHSSGARSRPRLSCTPAKIKETKPSEAAIRFAFGAATSAVAAILSATVSPVLAGTLLAFPAILLASLTLIADEEGQAAARDDARGAIAGALGLVAFAVIGAHFFNRAATPYAFVLAAIGWVAVAPGCYAVAWFAGLGADERQ